MLSPRIPGHTCPLIDDVKDIIEMVFKIADRAEDGDDFSEMRGAMHEIRFHLSGTADKLEPIRAANLALRTAAEYWQEECEELSKAQE